MPVENTSPNRNYPLPFKENELQDDVARLIGAISGIDLDIANILVSLALKSENGHGHVVSDITGLAAALAAKQDAEQKGLANGFASLGADGKVPAGQLPSAVFGALSYQGTWNANTNAPTIPAANASNKGWYYKVSTPGSTSIGGIDDWKVGDWVVSNGTGWDKVDNTESVVSVAGLTGAIGAAALLAAIGAATAAQGAKADSAIQPGDLGSAAFAAAGSFAQRDSSGDVSARLFRSEYDSTNGSVNFIMTQIDTGSNNYIRPSTPAQVASALAPELTYSGASANTTSFPIGHIVAAVGNTTRNSADAVYLAGSSSSYTTVGPGSQLAGTWRSRGRSGQFSDGTNHCIYERVG